MNRTGYSVGTPPNNYGTEKARGRLARRHRAIGVWRKGRMERRWPAGRPEVIDEWRDERPGRHSWVCP